MKCQGNSVPNESSVQAFFVKVALNGAINRKLLFRAKAPSLPVWKNTSSVAIYLLSKY